MYSQFCRKVVVRNSAHNTRTVTGVIVASARAAMDHPGGQDLRILDYLRERYIVLIREHCYIFPW